MSVPQPTDSTSRNRLYGNVYRGAAVVAAVCLLGTMAVAQSRLGATDGRYPLGGPASDASRELRPIEASELAAARMLMLARQDLVQGRRAGAQRLLEQLIARYPDSASAGDARRELYALYAADAKVANGQRSASVPPAASAPAASPRVDTSVAAVPEPSNPAATPSVGTGWRTSVVSFRRLQDDLRNSVGDRLFFSAGSTELGSRARALLAAQAEWLLRRPEVEVVVEGHADDATIGADDDVLASQRAAAVRDRLMAEGVEADRIRIVPLGSRDRVATCGDSDCAAQNRRVVVLVGVRGSHAQRNPTEPARPHDRPVDVRR